MFGVWQRTLYLSPSMKLKSFSQIAPLCNRYKIPTYVKKADKYYDLHYLRLLGPEKWKTVRKILKSNACPGILVNNFADSEEIIKDIEANNAICLMDQYRISTKLYLNKRQSSAVDNSNENQQIMLDEDHIYEREPVKKYDDSSRLISASEGLQSMAILEGHIPSTHILSHDPAIEETDVFEESSRLIEVDKRLLSPIQIVDRNEPLPWPGNFLMYTYLANSMEEGYFPESMKCPMLNIHSHLECDLAMLLPIIALDLQQFDKVLDFNPESGKSLYILQTLFEVSLDLAFSSSYHSRKTIQENLTYYIPTEELENVNEIELGAHNLNYYNKILYHANSLDDRHSLTENSKSNIFAPSRIMERMNMSAKDAEKVVLCLKLLAVGGSMVYSTKTLSPLHNDGVIMLALRTIQMETDIKIVVENLNATMKCVSFVFNFGQNLDVRYGHLVVPRNDKRQGPLYVCKLKRVK